MTDLSKMCIYYRAKNEMSQASLAKLCGVSRDVIIKAENGKTVSKVTEAKIKLAIENAE